jgi:hypothetical protein
MFTTFKCLNSGGLRASAAVSIYRLGYLSVALRAQRIVDRMHDGNYSQEGSFPGRFAVAAR